MAKTSIIGPIWVSKIDRPVHPGRIGVSIYGSIQSDVGDPG